MGKKLIPMSKSPRYREFVTQRDQALEAIHSRFQYQLTDILGGALQRTMEIVSYWYDHSRSSQQLMKSTDMDITGTFHNAGLEMVQVVQHMRRNAYILANAGEAEAMARTTGKKSKVSLSKDKLAKIANKEMPAGGTIQARVDLYLGRLKRKILDAIHMSATLDEERGEAMERVKRAFPAIRHYRKPQNELKAVKMTESEKSDRIAHVLGYIQPDNESKSSRMEPVTLTEGLIDADEWSDMLDSYQKEYVPKWRGPDSDLEVMKGEGRPQYAWELERDMTQDFVQQVRDGQVDSANENDIDEFQWISVIDSKTDDCCVWRDGLSTSEIELELSGEHSEDECDATVPPAHFNCRCTLAPMTTDMPESPPQRIGEFSEWLEQTTL